ncbi:hypothetical protein GOP47_0025386 [Adiantum capillus-veneris]|uniref:Uncharacterized protein n=1 Tax=Adiantum capillus-veneris TaxID=13818 RepID=A0A9D4U0W4_ADICA|nr:hypothetical protein GOP47_0025386 [Adiantum capillus-veneris]
MAAAEEEGRAPFHVVHKVPAGDGFYVRAKHAQLVERKPEKAIALFWASLEAGDRVDSALKDLAIVLKQQNRPRDAILAVCTFRSRCSESAQDSLDNVLLDLYKSSGRLDDQIALLIRKLRAFQNCHSFNGKRTKTARSQGKKFQISVEQEVARLLGNLGWAYMQQSNYKDAESAYRRALALEVDSNKACNLGVCLMKQGKAEEAMAVLQGASLSNNKRANSGSHLKSYERAQELMRQASAMSMLTGSGETSARTTALWTASLLNEEGVHSHSRSKRVCDGRSNTITLSEAIIRDEHAHIRTTKNKDDEDMIGRVAAAYHGQDDDRIAAGSACADSQGSSHLGTQNVDEGTLSPLRVAPILAIPLLNSSRQSQTHARRRLPVFRDITLLGSAAA